MNLDLNPPAFAAVKYCQYLKSSASFFFFPGFPVFSVVLLVSQPFKYIGFLFFFLVKTSINYINSSDTVLGVG